MFNSRKQYSFGLIFSLNPKKTHTDQVYYKFCYPVQKETNFKLSKVSAAKQFFSSVYVTVA